MSFGPTLDGSWHGSILTGPEDGELINTALQSLMRPAGPEDTRTPAQRRHDALADLAAAHLNRGEAPIASGQRPHLTVIIEASALDNALDGTPGSPPADLHWGGTLSAEAAVRIACDAEITPIIGAPHPTDRDDPAGEPGEAADPGGDPLGSHPADAACCQTGPAAGDDDATELAARG